MNRVTLPLLLAACAAAGGWVWEHGQRTRLEDRVAQLELEASSRAVTGTEESNAGDRRVARKGKAGAEEAAGAGEEADSGKASGSLSKQDATGEMAAGFAKMIATNPKMREMVKSQFRAGMDQVYRDLFDLLELDEEKRAKLEKLINERGFVGLNAGLALMEGDSTDEDRKAAAAQVKAKLAELDGQIKDLLGGAEYDKLMRYEDSSLERLQLKSFNAMLTPKDIRLDESTETRLMDLMYKEREQFSFVSSFLDHRNPDILRFNAENTSRFSDEHARLNESIAEKASGFLTEEQSGLLRQSQEEQRNIINMQLGVAVRMFSGTGGK